MTDITERANTLATEASKPGTFNFIDRVTGRNYPKDEVVVYLDEESGYNISKIEKELELAGQKIKLAGDDKVLLAEAKAQVDQLEAQLEANREKASESRFVFHLEGISTRDYDKCVDEAQEQFPLEYTETRNPLTFKLEREVVENDDRETYFRTLLWSKFIRRVVDPSGNEDSTISHEWVKQVADLLPIMAQIKVATGVETLRMATDWMDHIQGEDFLAKS